jgi:hypothetical protein
MNQNVDIDRLRQALRKKRPSADIYVSTFDGGMTATLLDVPELVAPKNRVSMAWGDGIDPMRVLYGRLLDAHVLVEADLDDIQPTQEPVQHSAAPAHQDGQGGEDEPGSVLP